MSILLDRGTCDLFDDGRRARTGRRSEEHFRNGSTARAHSIRDLRPGYHPRRKTVLRWHLRRAGPVLARPSSPARSRSRMRRLVVVSSTLLLAETHGRMLAQLRIPSVFDESVVGTEMVYLTGLGDGGRARGTAPGSTTLLLGSSGAGNYPAELALDVTRLLGDERRDPGGHQRVRDRREDRRQATSKRSAPAKSAT